MDPKKKADGTSASGATEPNAVPAHGENWHKEQPHPEHVLGTERPDEIPDLDEAGGGSMPTGTQTGQTGRGSYGTDQSTGGGAYMDRSAGTFGTEPVAQPGTDQENEPDAVDPQL